MPVNFMSRSNLAMVKSYLGIIQFMECCDCGHKLFRTTGEGFIFEKKAQVSLVCFKFLKLERNCDQFDVHVPLLLS